MRADNYALSEETKRVRDQRAGAADRRGLPRTLSVCCAKHRPALDRVANALLEKETLDRDELDALLADVEPDSRSSETRRHCPGGATASDSLAAD